MKIIFSRKGFDSSAGGFPSPIFPDGTLFPIPIPDKGTSISYADLDFSYEGDSIQKILNDLTGKRIVLRKKEFCDYASTKFKCHLDPMIIEKFSVIAFGQAGASASHLLKQKVTEGDIFLFFGWFKEVEKGKDGKWRYKKGSLDLHVIWGFMQVGEIISLDKEDKHNVLNKYPFLNKHPHIEVKRKYPSVIFLSKREWKKFPFKREVILTDIKDYRGRSFWRLPKYFNQPQAFSYLKNFTLNKDDVEIKIPGRGQEFVLDLDKVEPFDREKILSFVGNLINR